MGRDRTSEYKAKVHRWARLPVPFWFGKGRDGPERQTAQAWMVRNDVSETEVRSAAFTSMVTLAVVSGSMSAVLYLLLPTQQLLFAGLGLAMLPLMTAMSLLSFPFQRASEEERAMMRESPGVIGALSMSINVRPSLEAAVSFAAHGDGLLCHRLRASWWESISGRRASLEMSVMDMAASLGEMNESLRQAIILTIASTKQGTRSGIDRLLDLANRVVLDGIRERGTGMWHRSLCLPWCCSPSECCCR